MFTCNHKSKRQDKSKTVSLPASEQSQINVLWKAIVIALELFWPRTEGRKLSQVDLWSLLLGAKFTELANIAGCSQDWSHWISNISQTSISKHPLLSCDVTWTLALQRQMSQDLSTIYQFFFTTDKDPEMLLFWFLLIKNSLFPSVCPCLYWWGSWQSTLRDVQTLCCSSSQRMSPLLLSWVPIMELMSVRNLRTWTHTQTQTQQPIRHTGCLSVSQYVVLRRMTV